MLLFHRKPYYLKLGLKTVRCAINKFIEQEYMEIDGNKVRLHFHMGGDYKISKIHVVNISWFKLENIKA